MYSGDLLTQQGYEDNWIFQQKELRKKETKPMENKNYVFVYGSLLSGLSNNHRLEGSKLICKGVTKDLFCMISFGGFPGLISNPNDQQTPMEKVRSKSLFLQTEGEVYEVSDATLQGSLDSLEGNGRFYTRELIKINGLKENDGMAWCYLLPKSHLDKEVCLPTDDRLYSWKFYLDVLADKRLNNNKA